MLKVNEFEKLLIKNWSVFLDIRKVIEYAKNTAIEQLGFQSPKIQTLSVSRCEIQNNGLIVWIDYKILESDRKVNATTEFFLSNDGSTVRHIKTI